MSNIVQQIQIDAGELLTFINSVLPVVEANVPAIAGAAGPIGLGVSAAAALLPLLSKIPIGPVFTAEVQQDILNRVQARALLDFSGPVWQKSTTEAAPTVIPLAGSESPSIPPAE